MRELPGCPMSRCSGLDDILGFITCRQHRRGPAGAAVPEPGQPAALRPPGQDHVRLRRRQEGCAERPGCQLVRTSVTTVFLCPPLTARRQE